MALSLEDFLVRTRVLKLYRHALRISRRAPPHARADLRQIIRQEMENNRNCNDKQRIRFLISDGIERLTSCNTNIVVTSRINQRRAANIGGSCTLAISAWFIPCCHLSELIVFQLTSN
ncbi:hypothetical protein H5410_030703 [Solanum commersonii]|uniref:LYR motif-containing protein 2 n=1 Tax=Solanum commersonii TaxID=4109 RepID=A0A9J5YGZ7_SOLCO|nr:hypothetical protein H5410_030703 [Solanum commersonii]